MFILCSLPIPVVHIVGHNIKLELTGCHTAHIDPTTGHSTSWSSKHDVVFLYSSIWLCGESTVCLAGFGPLKMLFRTTSDDFPVHLCLRKKKKAQRHLCVHQGSDVVISGLRNPQDNTIVYLYSCWEHKQAHYWPLILAPGKHVYAELKINIPNASPNQ